MHVNVLYRLAYGPCCNGRGQPRTSCGCLVGERKHLRLTFKSGAVIPLLLMLPNIAWMLLPKLDAGFQGSVPITLALGENVARGAVLALPFFYSLDLKKKHSTLALVGMVLTLSVYYSAWGRFFVGGGSAELLSEPLLGIPSPLAFAPIAFLLVSSYLVNSWWMFGASACFGALHIWVKAVTSVA